MTSRRKKTALRAGIRAGRYAVVCQRFDGREREFQRYDTRNESDLVAKHLTKIGCPSRVIDTEGGAP